MATLTRYDNMKCERRVHNIQYDTICCNVILFISRPLDNILQPAEFALIDLIRTTLGTSSNIIYYYIGIYYIMGVHRVGVKAERRVRSLYCIQYNSLCGFVGQGHSLSAGCSVVVTVAVYFSMPQDRCRDLWSKYYLLLSFSILLLWCAKKFFTTYVSIH